MERTVVHVPGGRYPLLWIGQAAVVTPPVEIDITNAGQVREELLSVINEGAVLLIVDLSKTTFCDSAGVGALVRTFRRASASGGEMRLVVGTLAVQRVLAVTGIDRLLDIYPCVTAALAGPPGELRPNDQSQSDNVTAKADSDGGAA
jgi:anti-sigma B factor antagonist